jgi:hypothetical protein
MRLTIGSLAILAVLAGCDAQPAASASYQATAVVEIVPPWAAPDGPRAAEPDDARIDTAIEKIRLPQTIARAVREARLASLPEFSGRTEDDIAAEIASGLSVRRLARAWLVEIVVAGETPGVLDGEANALAAASVAEETSSASTDVERRRLTLEQVVAAEDAKIRLAQSQVRNALQKSNFSAATGSGEMDTLRARLARLTEKEDQIAMDLIHLEAQPKSSAMTADERDAIATKRKALTNEQAALASLASQTRNQMAAAGKALADVDDLNGEVARRMESRTAAMREMETLAARTTEPQRTARIVAKASEPASIR